VELGYRRISGTVTDSECLSSCGCGHQMALARFQRLANFTDGAGDHGVVVGEVEFGVDNITVTTGLFICA